MDIEENPIANAMLTLHKRACQDIGMLLSLIMREAFDSGRHTPASMADLLEEIGQGFEGYEGSVTQATAKSLRSDGVMPSSFTIIDGGKKD